MDIKLAQKRVNDLSAAMVAKGMIAPQAELHLSSNKLPGVYLRWSDKSERYGTASEWVEADTVAEVFDEASSFIAARPTAKQARIEEFMRCLGKAIDLGRESHIEVEFLNPLVATMKTLSENVITDQRAA